LERTGQETRILAEIWEEAIRLHGCDITDKSLALLRNDKTADIHRVENSITEFTAEKVWSRLKEQSSDRACFYHDTLDGDKVRTLLVLALQILIIPFKYRMPRLSGTA
jgi:hypothetical protein